MRLCALPFGPLRAGKHQKVSTATKAYGARTSQYLYDGARARACLPSARLCACCHEWNSSYCHCWP